MALKKIGKDRYCVTVSVRPKNGRPFHKQVTVVGTLADAKRAEVDLYGELQARSLTSAYASTFGQAAELFLQNRRERGDLSPSHERMVKFVQRELGHIRLEVFSDQFAAYRKHIAQGVTARGKPRKSASVNRYTTIVRAVFNYLVGMEIIDRNPITPVKFPKLKEAARKRMLTPEEYLRLLTAINELRPYILPLVRYMSAVPCRSGELLGIGREQYSPITNTIFVPDSKAGVSIYKPVPPSMTGYFRSLPADCPWLFYKEAGGAYRPITRQVLRKAWEHCLRKSGVSDYRIHDLRHKAVTGLYKMKNNEFDVAAVAGWIPKTVNPMALIYNDVEKVEAAQRIVFPPEVSGSLQESVDFLPVEKGGTAAAM